MQILLPINTDNILTLETVRKLQDIAKTRGLSFEELASEALQAVADAEPRELQPMPVQ